MAQYHMVYDAKGEPFEVSEEKASTLILNEGWSRTPPVKAPAPAPAPVFYDAVAPADTFAVGELEAFPVEADDVAEPARKVFATKRGK